MPIKNAKNQTIPTSNTTKSFLPTNNKHSLRVQINNSNNSSPPKVRRSSHLKNSIALLAPILTKHPLPTPQTSAPNIPKTSSPTTDQLLSAMGEKL